MKYLALIYNSDSLYFLLSEEHLTYLYKLLIIK